MDGMRFLVTVAGVAPASGFVSYRVVLPCDCRLMEASLSAKTLTGDYAAMRLTRRPAAGGDPLYISETGHAVEPPATVAVLAAGQFDQAEAGRFLKGDFLDIELEAPSGTGDEVLVVATFLEG